MGRPWNKNDPLGLAVTPSIPKSTSSSAVSVTVRDPKFTEADKREWVGIVTDLEMKLKDWEKNEAENEDWQQTDEKLNRLSDCFFHPVMAKEIQNYDYDRYISNIKG